MNRSKVETVTALSLRTATLILGLNKIGDAGVQALANVCARGALAQLKCLYLNGNQIGDAGMVDFSRAIASGSLPAFTHVDLYDNPGDSAPVHEALANRNA